MPTQRSIEQTIELLTGVAKGEASAVCEEVEAWAKAGRVADLVALAAALETACPVAGAPERRSAFETAADHVEDQLALLPEAAAIDALVGLSLIPRVQSVTVPRDRSIRVRSFASRLGFGQPHHAFLAALDRLGGRAEHEELLACWMHEIILRGASLESEERAVRFAAQLRAAKHPLGDLPLALRPAEREAPSYMPLYGDKGLGRAIERLTSGAMSVRTLPPPADGAAVRATLRADEDAFRRMKAAVAPWSKTEAKIFDLAPPILPENVGSWLLRALPLEATSGVARLDCTRSGPEGAFGPLFSAASNGGAYSAGLGGAYGRRAAWTSLGGLVGAPADATIAAVEPVAQAATFLGFRAPGPWFFDVAWDLGLLVLRPDGRSVAVLASTDSD
jgi:hypothetical protein